MTPDGNNHIENGTDVPEGDSLKNRRKEDTLEAERRDALKDRKMRDDEVYSSEDLRAADWTDDDMCAAAGFAVKGPRPGTDGLPKASLSAATTTSRNEAGDESTSRRTPMPH